MPRAPRNQLVPWIESLILGYGTGEEGGGGGRLKAHVIGVGELPQSQARSSEGRPGLLFLSDGLLQLPAVLTASAWEQLQEQEERECIRSLVNSTVCIRDYRLQLCVAPQPVRCRFFLSVGELATTAAGPVRDSPPCCTTLPSVRQKILQAWGALQGPELQESQRSQAGLDLSELLGEWQLDCVQTVLDDVQSRLGGASSPQPSTSTHPPLPTQPAPCGATTWDVDRVRHKAERRFTVPVQCLLLPEEDALRLQAPPEVSSRKPSEPPAASEVTRSDAPPPPDATQPPSDEAAALSSTPAVVGTDTDEVSPSPVDPEDETAHLIYSHITLLSNPWDVYSPPSSDASPEATPTPPLQAPTAAESKPDHAAMLTSTQLPALSLERTVTSGIPPYQQPPCSTSLPETAGASASPSPVSPAEPFSRAADTSLATDERCNDTAQPNPHGEDGDGEEDGEGDEDGEGEEDEEGEEEAEDGKHGKRRRREEEQREEAQESGTPPSWLFDTQAGLWAEEGVAHTKGQRSRSARRRTPTVHSCGRTFSYSYQVSGQNLQDVSGLPVSESLLHWAVKYLVPKRTEPPPPTCL